MKKQLRFLPPRLMLQRGGGPISCSFYSARNMVSIGETPEVEEKQHVGEEKAWKKSVEDVW